MGDSESDDASSVYSELEREAELESVKMAVWTELPHVSHSCNCF